MLQPDGLLLSLFGYIRSTLATRGVYVYLRDHWKDMTDQIQPGAWVVVAEVFPLGVRAKGISIGASSNWLNNFAVSLPSQNSHYCAKIWQIGQATPDMVKSMGYGTFIFFGLMCFIGAAFVWYFVPETKNLSLEEMDEVFGDEAGNALEDRRRLDRIYGELGLIDSDSARGEHEEKEIQADGVEVERL